MADDADLVLTEVDADGVATFTLNRPGRRNAWTAAMENRYFDVLAAADTDPAVRVAVLTGAGTSFCPGLDMSRLAEVAGRPVDISARRAQYVPRLFRKPLIAAINGACAGIGLTQALMCDVRFAARGARFSTAFARRGLGAEYGMSWVLPRYVGVGNALDLLLSSRVFEADEAQALGLVNRVLEPAEVLPAARAYARDLARNCSPAAMAAGEQLRARSRAYSRAAGSTSPGSRTRFTSPRSLASSASKTRLDRSRSIALPAPT